VKPWQVGEKCQVTFLFQDLLLAKSFGHKLNPEVLDERGLL
jgi:hypothetical protein